MSRLHYNVGMANTRNITRPTKQAVLTALEQLSSYEWEDKETVHGFRAVDVRYRIGGYGITWVTTMAVLDELVQQGLVHKCQGAPPRYRLVGC